VHHLGAAQPFGLHAHGRADRVAVAVGAGQANGQRRAACGEVVPEHPQLRRLSRRHDHEVRVAVAIDVHDHERAAILIEIETHGGGHVVEAAFAVVAQEHVALAAWRSTRASAAG
jgi:hypothetical protein